MARALEERGTGSSAEGIHYLVLLAPDKHTIYPEYIPGRYEHVSPATRFDQFYDYLRQHTRLDLVDLRTPLRRAKSHERLYLRRDTHWNDRGAFIGYQTIIAALSRSVSRHAGNPAIGVQARPLDEDECRPLDHARPG